MKAKVSTSKKMKKYDGGGQTSPTGASGSGSTGPGRGGKTKTVSPGGSYVTKKQYDDQGNLLKQTERRTLKGFISGAPGAKGTTFQAYKKGGSVGKSKKK